MSSGVIPGHDIIAIGASSGGFEALQVILAGLPANLPATIFIVIHRHPESSDSMAGLLSSFGPLTVSIPHDGESYRQSHIYLAPPNQHMLLDGGVIRLSNGPRENRSRPAIDPLFRSAAVYGRTRTVGVILCGMLNDGVSGLVAIRRCGGRTIVRDPEQALYPDLPRAAVEQADPDMILSLPDITHEIIRLAGTASEETPPDIPEEIAMEVEIALGTGDQARSEKLGDIVAIGCPECGGTLRQIHQGDTERFRCPMGHAYTATTLLEEQGDALEKALWIALRTLEERATTLDLLDKESRERAMEQSSSLYGNRAQETRDEAETIRQVLLQRRERRLGRKEEGV